MNKIAIVEDDVTCSNLLVNYLCRYNKENGQNVQADVFRSAVDFLSDYDCSYFAVFMDIDMPMMNGMDAARKLRLADQSVSIIFTTNLANYAISGYEVNALDFMVKPITYFNFVSKLEKAVTAHKTSTDLPIQINLKDKMVVVKSSELYYVESDAHMVIYHTAKGDFAVRKKLCEAEEALKDCNMAYCGKSYLVNLYNVDSVDGKTVTVHGKPLPISRSKEKDFMRALTLYLGGNSVGGG